LLARDAAASIRDGIRHVANGGELSAPDDRTLPFHLTKSFPHLLSALLAGSSTTMRCIMPERLATTDLFRQVAEMIWSGPCRFLPTEFSWGERAAYGRFTGYLPRSEEL
jgi:peptide/nickel transport system substrate-binding protein